MEIPILISVLTRIPQKKLNSPPRSAILRDFLNQENRFTIPDTADRNIRRATQAITKRYAVDANAAMIKYSLKIN